MKITACEEISLYSLNKISHFSRGQCYKTSLGNKFDNTDIEFYMSNKICNQTDLDISCFAYFHLTEIEVSMCMERVNKMCSISYTPITFTSGLFAHCSYNINLYYIVICFIISINISQMRIQA